MRQSTVDRRGELYADARRVIEQRYADGDLTLDRVAREIATSRRQLQRAFAEAGATSFRCEVERVRMERAADLLRMNGMPVQQVAEAVGYRQAAQFAKVFKRRHGVSPSELRAS